jgi:uncharacterized protein (DUF1800 family)
MRHVALVVIGALVGTSALVAQPRGSFRDLPGDEASIAHALDRLAFGPRPGDLAHVREMGLAAWIERQLHPERIPDGVLAEKLARLSTLSLDAAEIARAYVLPARDARRARQQAAARAHERGGAMEPGLEPQMTPAAPRRSAAERAIQNVLAEMSEARLLRAVYSERQLEEVLVDFWFNHFNVFARKGQIPIYLGEYEREAIRPHVLGRFRDLLGATAKSPAMLIYLDNWQSVAPDARAQAVLARRGGQRTRRGLNENYARELLELHTLGADGGYTQQDVVEVARAFTGWTIRRPETPGFRFVAAMHDRGEKTVLGQRLPAGGGIEDGERVLDILARHPSTARHIAFKLAQRFVSDAPPPALVDRAAAVFASTDGDLREVVRAIVTSPEFFDPAARRGKVKTPLEFVASALRAVSADIVTARPLLRTLADMGMPLYLCQPPTGYDEEAAAWVSSGAVVARINFALALARGEVRGVRVPADAPALAEIGSAEFQKQ